MAQEDVRLSGTQLDSTGAAVEGLTVSLFAEGETTSAVATDTTDSNGEWDFTRTTPGRYDVQIVDGSETFRILARDKFQVTELTTRNPTTALPALSAYSTTSEASSLVATFGFRPSTEASGVETPDTPSDNDEGYINFTLSNDNATPQQWDAARITWIGTDVSDGTEDADLEFETMVAGSLATALKIGVSGATGSIIKDEDNMVSDSAVHLATQQSIKAYVDSQIGSNNELSEVLANGNTTGGTDISVSSGDDITFADSASAIFGTGSDATINYDGTNLVITPDAVGSGYASLNGDVRVANDHGIVVGHTAQLATNVGTSEFQIIGTGGPDGSAMIGRFSANGGGASIDFLKSRNGTIGSNTIVNDNDAVAVLRGNVDDGTDYTTPIGDLTLEVDDGSPAANAVGGAWRFRTTTTAGSLTEALRIDSSQRSTFSAALKLSGNEASVLTDANYIRYASASGDTHLDSQGGLFVNIDSNNNGTSAVFGVRSNASSTDLFAVGEGGTAYIGDTANANMTVGLTINQGANDDQALTLKSSDVATGLTTATAPDTETDDYATFSKSSFLGGGLRIQALNENDSNPSPMLFRSWGGTAATAKTTSAESLVQFDIFEHDGSNGIANITADGNVFGITARVGGSSLTRFLIDEDGDMYSVTAGQTFDDYDDLVALDYYDKVRSGMISPKDAIKASYGKYAEYNEKALIEMGVLGDTIANGGLTNQSQLSRLLTGGVRKLSENHMSLAEEVQSLRSDLAIAQKQLKALSN